MVSSFFSICLVYSCMGTCVSRTTLKKECSYKSRALVRSQIKLPDGQHWCGLCLKIFNCVLYNGLCSCHRCWSSCPCCEDALAYVEFYCSKKCFTDSVIIDPESPDSPMSSLDLDLHSSND